MGLETYLPHLTQFSYFQNSEDGMLKWPMVWTHY